MFGTEAKKEIDDTSETRMGPKWPCLVVVGQETMRTGAWSPDSAREGAAGAVHHCNDSKFKLGPLYLRPGSLDFSKNVPHFGHTVTPLLCFSQYIMEI